MKINSFNINLVVNHDKRIKIQLQKVKNAKTLQDKLIKLLQPIDNGFQLTRIGRDGDGGYLLPDDFVGIESCCSIGCDNSWSFESDLLKFFGINSYILDEESKRPSNLSPGLHYFPAWLGIFNNNNFITLESFLDVYHLSDKFNLILQMDIEGAEYSILRELEENTLKKFRILVIEFHNLEKLTNFYYLETVLLPVLEKMSINFDVVHFHANNCRDAFHFGKYLLTDVVEVTFHNKNRRMVNASLENRPIPNPLDKPNVINKADVRVKLM